METEEFPILEHLFMPDANHDLNYDGHTLTWTPAGEDAVLSFKATSGLFEGAGSDFRVTSAQCQQDRGPLPEGSYVLSLVMDKSPAADDGKGICNLRPSTKIQSIPRGKAAGECELHWANWGENRVRIEPADRKTKEACKPRRSGFYIHDSAKGYTHGCIETEKTFFTLLRKYAGRVRGGRLNLRVLYAYTTTNGGTGSP